MTAEDGKHFGNRLREARVEAGFSQSELEELSGIPKARLSRYENGHVEPSIQTLARLARALNVSEASLLGDHRAILEGFFGVLSDAWRPYRFRGSGRPVANAVADMVQASAACRPSASTAPLQVSDPTRRDSETSWVDGHLRASTSPDDRRRSIKPEGRSAHDRDHRRCEDRRPRDPRRRSRVIRRVLPAIVAANRPCSLAGQRVSLDLGRLCARCTSTGANGTTGS